MKNELNSSRFLKRTAQNAPIHVWAHVLATDSAAGFALDRARYPRLADYLDRVWARPSFAAVIERERSLLARLRG